MYEQPDQNDKQKVGIREFRENIARFVEGPHPIAITKHGETVGFYIPTKRKPTQEDLDALVVASEKMKKMMEEAGITEEEIIQDFKELREAEKGKE